MKIKGTLLLALAAALSIMMSGCTVSNIDELYSLPQPQEEFLQLQELINNEISAGSEYSAPTVGSIRQTVRLADLDGDGLDEALAFLKNKEQQPEICIYRNIDDKYVLTMKITGEGTGIGRFEYADIDGDGFCEILVSFKVSEELLLLKAYSMKDWVSSVLLTTNCTDFQIGDPDNNGTLDAVVLNFSSQNGTVEMFTADTNGEMTKTGQNLSDAMSSVERFRVANLSDGTPAIFVEGSTDSHETEVYITDIFVCMDGKLRNIAMGSNADSSATQRSYQVYSTDINGDGALEVPFAEKLPSQPKVTTEYYVFDWYGYNVAGERTLVSSTYHCYNDGWYLILPQQWRENLTIRRESGITGERTVVLSFMDADSGEIRDLITIYTLSDENRADRAKLDGRFVLLKSETVIYAAKLYTEDGQPPTEQQMQEIIGSFRVIYSEWNTGAV